MHQDHHQCDNMHHHHHHHHHSREEGAAALWRALIVTFLFMVVEIVGGYLSNSLALMSDAAHMLTDVGAMLLSIFVFWMAKRPYSATMSFGYHRAEILGALASGLAIWAIAGLLVYHAILRMTEPPEVKGPLLFVVAVIGLSANLVSMKMLHATKKHNLNVRAAYLHVVMDSLGSVAAVITGLVLWSTGWRLIDPIVTVVLAGMMLYSSWGLIKESVGVLMESTPTGLNTGEIVSCLGQVQGVQEVHDLHVWTLSSGRLALSVHLISNDPEQAVLAQAHELLQKEYGIIHTTIQIEHPEKFASERCYDCAHD